MAWIAERAFFSSAVNRAQVLDGLRDATGQYVKGEIGRAKARELITEHLDRLNYKALPGQEGTVKDLRSETRQNLILDTNLLQVHNWAAWTRQQDALADYPAQKLVRISARKKHRNWISRWDAAFSQVDEDGATGAKEMVALINHPIWIAISRFHTPYPPFDFNSGMGVVPVSRAEAEDLGIIPDQDSPPSFRAMMEPQDRGLNETLASAPAISSQAIRAALAAQMQGMAKWGKNDEGEDSLNFTDPNGTREHSASDLAAIWKEGMPAGLPLLQRDALREWLLDPAAFVKKNDRDKWEDLQRLHRRLVNGVIPSRLYALQRLPLNALGPLLSSDTFSVPKDLPGLLFTADAAAMRQSGNEATVVIEIANPPSDAFKDLTPFLKDKSAWMLRAGISFAAKATRTGEHSLHLLISPR